MISSLPQQVTISSQPSILSGVGAVRVTTQNTTPDTDEIYINESSDTFEKKEKIAKAAVISTVAIGAVIGGFALAKKGVLGKNLEKYANNAWDKITSILKKTPSNVSSAAATAETQASTVQDEAIKGVKKFFSNGKEIEGVKLEKGKAVLSDGSKFTGEMETLTKKGTKVKLTYQDGFITKSTKNGKLYKTFDSIDGFDRTSGTLIKEYKQGMQAKEFQHFYNKDGKISKTISSTKCNDFSSAEKVKEFADGRQIADYKIDERGGIKGSKYDADGTERLFDYSPDGSIEETIVKKSPDGSTEKITFEGKLEPNANVSELIATKPTKDIGKITTYDKTGFMKDKVYDIDYSGRLTISDPSGSNKIMVSNPSDCGYDKLQINRSGYDNTFKRFEVGLTNGKPKEVYKDEFMSGDLKDTINEIEKALDVAKKTGAKISSADIIQNTLKSVKKTWIR